MNLPETGLLREKQILGDPKASPPIPPIIPVKKTCWWEGVKSGRFPKPVYLPGGRAAFWRAEDIRALVESAQEEREQLEAETKAEMKAQARQAGKKPKRNSEHGRERQEPGKEKQ